LRMLAGKNKKPGAIRLRVGNQLYDS